MILAFLCGVLLVGGALYAWHGSQPAPVDDTPKPPSATARFLRSLRVRFTRQEQTVAVVSTVVGLALAMFTGWIIAPVALPAVLVLLPRMLSTKADKTRLQRLEAMEQWTRSLSGVLATGQGIRETLTRSLPAAPDAIQPEVSRMVARLSAGRDIEATLRQLADELDDAVGDSIVSTLIQGARSAGGGLQKVLDGLADLVAADVQSRRQVEAERQGNRSQAKWLTILVPAAFLGFILMSGLGEIYGTPLGQVVLVALGCAFLGCVWWIRLLTSPKPEPRWLSYSPDPTLEAA